MFPRWNNYIVKEKPVLKDLDDFSDSDENMDDQGEDDDDDDDSDEEEPSQDPYTYL